MNIKWYRTPVDMDNLRKLMQRSDMQGFVHILSHILLVTITGFTTYWLYLHQLWLGMGISLLVHGTCYSFFGWAGAGHELAHKKVFRSRIWNEIFLRFCAFITWNNSAYFIVSHSMHHQVTVHQGRDGEVVLPQKINIGSLLWTFTFDLPALYRALKITVENSFGIIKGEWGNMLFPISRPKERRKVYNQARFILIGHLLLSITFISTGYWPLVFLINLAPFIADGLSKILSHAQHMGMQPDVSDFRLNSRTVILNPLLSFLYWQMNYHVEHHMYPGIPFYNLKKLRKLLEYDLPEANHGVIPVFKELMMIQKRQSIDPGYFHIPDLSKIRS
jgi:fatty acid desaturase